MISWTHAASLKRFRVLTTLATLILFTSTDSSRLWAEAAELQPRAAARKPFSGEDIYRGVFLGHGPVARLLPEVRNRFAMDNYDLRPEERATVRRFHDRLIAALAADPTFFDRLQRSFTSGDHLVIERSLDWAGERTLHALPSIPEISELRRAIERDPKLLTELNDSIRRAQAGERLDPKALEAAIALAVNQSLATTSTTTSPYTAASSIVVVLVAVAAVVAAITVLALQSYAAVLNVAAAVSFAVAVVAVVKIAVPRRRKAVAAIDSGNLLREQLVDSIARYLVPSAA